MAAPKIVEPENENYAWGIGMWRAGIPFEQVDFITRMLYLDYWSCFHFGWNQSTRRWRTTVCANGGQWEYESESARRSVSRALREMRKRGRRIDV